MPHLEPCIQKRQCKVPRASPYDEVPPFQHHTLSPETCALQSPEGEAVCKQLDLAATLQAGFGPINQLLLGAQDQVSELQLGLALRGVGLT